VVCWNLHGCVVLRQRSILDGAGFAEFSDSVKGAKSKEAKEANKDKDHEGDDEIDYCWR